MKYRLKGHKDRNRHENRIKRSGQARLVYVKNKVAIPHHAKMSPWGREREKGGREGERERVGERERERERQGGERERERESGGRERERERKRERERLLIPNAQSIAEGHFKVEHKSSKQKVV